MGPEDEKRVWADAARRNPRIADAWDDLPEVTGWSGLLESDAFFSPFHFNGNEAFELPFHPRDYVYSPVIDVPVNPDAYGYYKRGVKKYRSMIERGETLPPITILYDERSGAWAVQDGGHRSMAAAQAGLTHQPAVLAFPVRLLEKVFGKEPDEDGPSP